MADTITTATDTVAILAFAQGRTPTFVDGRWTYDTTRTGVDAVQLGMFDTTDDGADALFDL